MAADEHQGLPGIVEGKGDGVDDVGFGTGADFTLRDDRLIPEGRAGFGEGLERFRFVEIGDEALEVCRPTGAGDGEGDADGLATGVNAEGDRLVGFAGEGEGVGSADERHAR